MNTASNVSDATFDEVAYQRAMSFVRPGTNGVMHVECFELAMGAKKRGAPWISKYASRCNYLHCTRNAGNVTAGARIGRVVRELFEAKTARTPRAARQAIDLDGDTNDSFPDYTGETATKEETTSFAAKLAPSGTDAASNIVVQALAAMLLPQIKSQIDTKLDAISPEALLENASKTINAAIEGKVSVYDSLVSDLLVAAEKRIAELSMPRQIEVKRWDGTSTNVGVQHKAFPLLLKVAQSGVPAYLHGSSGTGKTTGAMMVAKALGLPFYYTGAINDAFSLLGYKDVSGNYVETPFYKCVREGGVFLFDEVDASSPDALLAFNASLANNIVAFPCGVVEKHKDCILMASANTIAGADSTYTGRNKLDTAFLKRFAVVDWPIDEELELSASGNQAWAKHVQATRARVKAKGLRVVISPRESFTGARLLASGCSWEEVEQMTLRNGTSDDVWNQIRG